VIQDKIENPATKRWHTLQKARSCEDSGRLTGVRFSALTTFCPSFAPPLVTVFAPPRFVQLSLRWSCADFAAKLLVSVLG